MLKYFQPGKVPEKSKSDHGSGDECGSAASLLLGLRITCGNGEVINDTD